MISHDLYEEYQEELIQAERICCAKIRLLTPIKYSASFGHFGPYRSLIATDTPARLIATFGSFSSFLQG